MPGRLVLEGRPAPDIELRSGDIINLPEKKLSIYVVGAVKLPEAFGYARNLTILDYIGLAGGVDREADLAATTILRRGPDGVTKEKFDLKPAFKGDGAYPLITLKPGDVIVIPSKNKGKMNKILQFLMSGNLIDSIFDND